MSGEPALCFCKDEGGLTPLSCDPSLVGETEENQRSQQGGKCFDEAAGRGLWEHRRGPLSWRGAEGGKGAEAAFWKRQVGRDF